MDIVLYALTALLYAGLAVAGGRARHAGAQPLVVSGPAVGAQAREPAAAGIGGFGRVLLGAALLAHGVLLHMTIFPRDAMLFGFAFALSAMFWLGAGIYWIESFFFPLDGMRLLVLPLACVASLLPLVFGGVRVLPYAASPLFKAHFLIANVAYGLFAIAALHAVLMLMVERRLHTLQRDSAGWIAGWLDTLPPLLTLEKLLFRLIGAGFVLLTLTLVSGILFSEQIGAPALKLDHKTVFAVLSWLMFGGLIVAHQTSGWRGRGAARWVLASFVALLLAYVGSRFVLEVLLHRSVV
ncbi:ABC transporter permease [Burkholderia singularis]|uniref:ABC transporter permease n=1 Tax=Burkholderia singularis TaxID=1503053 RepID=A0A118DPD6_9BURK|nr:MULTISPECIES: cytochrome c biogenesis protein CcsA [Burkholderia]AOK28692.1 ABC transporter permease [Burkholderia sp. Bp7605]KVE27921.1 ABC transporter permease [Burkholderia singularis]SMG02362.1 FIG001154: CcsA-related protein [Burkholderia singularis]